jgi:hypothetical protein
VALLESKFHIEEIVWLDSQTLEGGGWIKVSDCEISENSMKHLSAGYVIKESDDAILIATNLNLPDTEEYQEIAGATVIPKVAIVQRKIVQRKKVQDRKPVGKSQKDKVTKTRRTKRSSAGRKPANKLRSVNMDKQAGQQDTRVSDRSKDNRKRFIPDRS